MTEAEWLAATDPQPMLEFLWGRASERKLRLYRCACCRQYEPELCANPPLRRAVALNENYADGLISQEVLDAARKECSSHHSFWKAVCFAVWPPTAHDPAQINRMAGARLAWQSVIPWFQGQQLDAVRTLKAKANGQASLLRDIFGNLFRPVFLDPAWLTWKDSTIRKLAQAVYANRAVDRLRVLADALEDAGCSDAGLLGHLRGPGPHVRGCWALDLLLGKE